MCIYLSSGNQPWQWKIADENDEFFMGKSSKSSIMATPDWSINHGLLTIGRYCPKSHDLILKWYLPNSLALGFIDPGLTLNGWFPLPCLTSGIQAEGARPSDPPGSCPNDLSGWCIIPTLSDVLCLNICTFIYVCMYVYIYRYIINNSWSLVFDFRSHTYI